MPNSGYRYSDRLLPEKFWIRRRLTPLRRTQRTVKTSFTSAERMLQSSAWWINEVDRNIVRTHYHNFLSISSSYAALWRHTSTNFWHQRFSHLSIFPSPIPRKCFLHFSWQISHFFYVLLTVHLSNLPTQRTNSCFIISLLYSSTCFEHCCAHHQEVKIVLYSIWYHHIL